MVLLQQMMVLFIYIIIGFFVSKKGIFGTNASKTFSWLVVNIANPALSLDAAINGEGKVPQDALIQAAILSIVMYLVLILLAQMITVVFRVSPEEKGIYKLMTIFNNIGFMGFPVIAAVYGSEALLYAVIFTLPNSLLFYTYGIATMRGKNVGTERFQWKKFLNVGVIAAVLSIVLYLGEIPMPQFIRTAVDGFSGLTAPLSMMVIGISLSALRLRDLFTDRKMLAYAAVKLLIMPVAGMVIIRYFVTEPMLLGVCMVMLATPVGSMVGMLAQQYERNVELASKGVAVTTILSVVTIPIVSAIVL